MTEKPNAKVILARCSKTRKLFGIRIEKRGGDWIRTWAFPIDERKAKREGFDAETVSGTMNAAPGYPGCPHCGAGGIVFCGCGKISCDGGIVELREHLEITCPWCKNTGILDSCESCEKIEVSGGGY